MNKLAKNFQWDSEDLRRRRSPPPPATASPRYWRYDNVMNTKRLPKPPAGRLA